MHYHEAWAAKGHRYGNRERHLQARSQQRAAVNIYRTDNSYEMLLFAPGRIREHFHLEVKGRELVISYTPPEGFPRPEWVVREYSRGAFVRSFALDDAIDTTRITAKYIDGVLEVSLPVIEGKERVQQEIPVG